VLGQVDKKFIACKADVGGTGMEVAGVGSHGVALLE